MQNLETLNQARRLAQELLKQAGENEPNITADLQTIAREISAEIVGLEDKFKTENSLIRKLIDNAEPNSLEVSQIAEKINDALRYTFILPFETYAEDFHNAVVKLRKSGYQIPESKIWNAWGNIGTKFDRGYRGINITIISSQKQKFELQLHTAESFKAKIESHRLYKEVRNRKTSLARKKEIGRYLVEKAEIIKVPEGVR